MSRVITPTIADGPAASLMIVGVNLIVSCGISLSSTTMQHLPLICFSADAVKSTELNSLTTSSSIATASMVTLFSPAGIVTDEGNLKSAGFWQIIFTFKSSLTALDTVRVIPNCSPSSNNDLEGVISMDGCSSSKSLPMLCTAA